MFQINEGTLCVPEQWLDKSLNIFQIPAQGQAKAASFIISRDETQGQRSFAHYIADQVRQCEEQLPGFQLLQRHILSDPCSYAWLDYTWQSPETKVLMRQLYFERRPAIVIMSLTTTPEDAHTHEATWREVIRSTQLTELSQPDPAARVL
ncbi:DcrB-related protein [Massilia sp. W12]|uniref:DcrB-related protein n=1 Tax=Massilia sp. W12 TaxID=3126507 RepID=UPI0030CCF8D0